MQESVLIKTPAGQQEIENRHLHLTPRLRALLVLIDGKHSAAALLESLKAIGVTEANLDQLMKQGLVAYATSPKTAPAPTPAPAPAAVVEPVRDSDPEVQVVLEGGQKIMALFDLFNALIRPTFGLRATALQTQLEQCATLPDYRDLSIEVLTHLKGMKGDEAAAKFKSRIEAIMGPINR